VFTVFCLALLSCISGTGPEDQAGPQFKLQDFYGENSKLDSLVESGMDSLDAQARIGQMIVTSAGSTGKPSSVVERLIKQRAIGGILMLGGEKDDLIALSKRFESLARLSGTLPFIYSSDAEPSLFNRKIKSTLSVPNTVEIESQDKCDSVASIISRELLEMKIRQNFAPVLDISLQNEAITNRTFGNDSSTVVSMATQFVRTTQELQIAATVKHFPGHGLVSGDTHHQLVTIDGRLQEVQNYIPLIEEGVISVMVGHIAVINNPRYQTQGLPASCSPTIVTELLKKELGFQGIVVTDAMNMGALKSIENASLKAIEAGCDMILMEPDELGLLRDAVALYEQDDDFRDQVDHSVRKILRLKLCLNLL
jgi:beta-N-acetylhexosaminidase